MKTLYILRHAKASGNFDDYADIDRPLKQKGIQDAYLLGDTLRKMSIDVDAVLASNSARTLHTASIVCRGANIMCGKIVVSSELYLPDDGKTLEFVHNLPDSLDKVMLVGHNPDLSYLCMELLSDPSHELPTCGFVAVSIDCNSWKDVSPSTTKKQYIIFP